MNRDEFSLKPVPPYRLDLTAWTLRRRVDNAIDRWDGTTYRRVLPTPEGPLEVAVVQTAPPESPRIHVSTRGAPLTHESRQAVTAALERLLGLRVDLTDFHKFAGSDKKLGPLARRFRGMKPPRFATLFEGVLNSIACQQVTLTLGIRLLNRLAERYGQKLHGAGEVAHAFPRPEDIAETTPEELRELGFSRNKGRAMIELARLEPGQFADLAKLDGLADAEAIARLSELRGVGRWSAEYVLLRYLGRTNLFPGDDVGARNNLTDWLNLSDPVNDYDEVARVLTPWMSFGGLIYFHLLLSRLAEAGLFEVEPAPPLGGDGRAAAPATKRAPRTAGARETKAMAKQPKKQDDAGRKQAGAKHEPRARGEPKPAPPSLPAGVDEVDESGKESFPASDPPAWSPLSSGPPKRD